MTIDKTTEFSGANWPIEPVIQDDTWKKYNETMLEWLNRSTLPRAVTARSFLRRNLSKIPLEYRDHFIHELGNRWDSAFIEFILARLICELRGKFTIEQINSDGKRPDYHVLFGNKGLVIEAVTPACDMEGDAERDRDAPLIDIINRESPKDWSISIVSLPVIGPEDSKKEFKECVKSMCRELPSKVPKNWHKQTHQLRQGFLHLEFYPDKLGTNPVISNRMYPIDDEKSRIQKAIKKKRKQVRAENVPVLLAVHGAGYGVTFNHFNQVIFGELLRGLPGEPKDPSFISGNQGVFADQMHVGKEPTLAGILAFTRIDLLRKKDPVLYWHPRYQGDLPHEITCFEQRRLLPSGHINIQSSEYSNILSRLDFVDDNLWLES